MEACLEEGKGRRQMWPFMPAAVRAIQNTEQSYGLAINICEPSLKAKMLPLCFLPFFIFFYFYSSVLYLCVYY